MKEDQDRPRPLAFLICQAVIPSPSHGLNLIEIGPDVYTWQFPNALPPHFAVCILTGGRPKTVYSTEWGLIDPTDSEVGRIAGPDAPFTSQIRRVNMFTQIQAIAPSYQVKQPGRFIVRLYVQGEEVGETDFTIQRSPKPPEALPTS